MYIHTYITINDYKVQPYKKSMVKDLPESDKNKKQNGSKLI